MSCNVPECDRTALARDVCGMHYQRLKKAGDPNGYMRVGKRPIRHGTAVAYNFHKCRCEECKVAHRKYHRDYHKKRPDVQVKRHLRHTYGIDITDYERMVQAQGGRCAICNQTPAEGKKLYVDHCHDSKRVRALLCQLCNVGLGSFSDDPVRLLAAAEYLFLQAEQVVA